ncbi:unnamed protein product [Effrenium voratum]|nr:unnamed protein product [Effrenium voratum]|mmetsp:Transcript_98928/g.236035  ORF Transcript_98928/g.236035 Transcript_98928/m.236035 type:complete len:276 (+) Transcript_98928:24-851(+)|eukprot:CAMPEP_0181435472 /NCGR_PEP_ID=MMETSP1110-20121109/20351_1 /TAXON_ID=174948 /ORGANISM="Symbiodinium sp., Strain CCMP421" /LENGTH=275 /DNA_ID=CAMNT_0023559009 /DNA_START=24 /DNA_END=851 /DNA_ORIENTATION=-
MKPWREGPGWAQLGAFELATLTTLPWLVGVLISYLFASTYHGMPLSVWLIALALLAVCLWHARHDAQREHRWHGILPMSCMAGVVASSALGLIAYRNFYSVYWLYHDSHAYANVLPSEPAATYLDAGKLVFAEEARIDYARGMGFKDGSTFCVAPIVDSEANASVQFWAAGVDCCGGRFDCDDAWDGKAHAGVRRAWREQYASAVRQAEAAYGLKSAKEPIFVQWVIDPEKVELNYWMLGNGVLVGSCLVSLVLSAVVNIVLLRFTSPQSFASEV